MRGIIALVVIAAIAAAAVFLVDNPGHVQIFWQDWQVDTSLGVLIGAAVLAALGVALVLWLLSLILGSPGMLGRRRRERRRRAGYQALTRGMVAVAAGEEQEAQRYAHRAEALLAEPPLTLLLSAQSAQLAGDELAARKFFSAMVERPETEFLGLRGLLNQALREGDRDAARHFAERAVALRPNAAWAAASLFDIEASEGRWEAARLALDRMARRRFVAPETARHRRGVLLHELSLAAEAGGESARALALAGEAQSLAPDLAAPAAHHARLLHSAGRAGRATAAIERAWRTAPHPELARQYGELLGNEPPLARVAGFARLAAQNPQARESHVALAEAAFAAQLWGEARRHLEQALAAEPPPPATAPASLAVVRPLPPNGVDGDVLAGATPRLCLMMARLEEAEHGDFTRMREWLGRAASTLPDPRYVCASCGAESPEWRSRCPRCGAFDAQAWRTPAWAASDGALPAPVGGLADERVAATAAIGPSLPVANSGKG